MKTFFSLNPITTKQHRKVNVQVSGAELSSSLTNPSSFNLLNVEEDEQIVHVMLSAEVIHADGFLFCSHGPLPRGFVVPRLIC